LSSIANTNVGTYSYAWDANHNKTSETISGALSGKGFSVPSGGYDNEDRLTAWNRSDSALSQSWSLSAVGDWSSFTENGVCQRSGLRSGRRIFPLHALGNPSASQSSFSP
jgi:hypothetical protein